MASLPGRRRGRFLICFGAGLLSVMLALAASIVLSASSVELFMRRITESVDLERLGISEADAGQYAAMTIGYITGSLSEWEPSIATRDGVMPVSESFKAHMANVRSWFSPAGVALAAGLIILLLLLACSVFGLKGFSIGGWYAGAALPLLALISVGIWALIDFGAMWYWLHVSFIPDGLFSISEPIIQLFPVELFAGYLKPAASVFGGVFAAVILAPAVTRLVLDKLHKKQEK